MYSIHIIALKNSASTVTARLLLKNGTFSVVLAIIITLPIAIGTFISSQTITCRAPNRLIIYRTGTVAWAEITIVLLTKFTMISSP